MVKTTDLISNNIENQSSIKINSLSTFDLTTHNLNVTNFSSYFPAFSPSTYTPAYYIDGNVASNGYVMQSVHPILSSVRSLGSNDDAFIVVM